MLSFLSVLVFLGISVLSAVSVNLIPPFPGGCCFGDQCGPEAKWCTDVLNIFSETGCQLWVVC